MTRERLELVPDFSSLRAGMIVVINPCRWPGCASHRGMLVRFLPNAIGQMPNGGRVQRDAWELAPNCCHKLPLGINCHTVEQKQVFRVVDGLDPAADAQTDERVAYGALNRLAKETAKVRR